MDTESRATTYKRRTSKTWELHDSDVMTLPRDDVICIPRPSISPGARAVISAMQNLADPFYPDYEETEAFLMKETEKTLLRLESFDS